MSIKNTARQGLNKLLRLADLELVRRSRARRSSQGDADVKSYLDFEETSRQAKKEGLRISEYVEKTYNPTGDSEETVARMIELGLIAENTRRICEIGPGSGRYLERTIEACSPEHVEIYETAKDWSDWLVETHDVVARQPDGRSLSETPSDSLDLVSVHKTFVYIPFVTTCSYLREIDRVLRPGGAVFFDAVTETCMDDETVQNWIENGSTYPCFLARQYLIDFFENRGYRLAGTFYIPLTPGRTECFGLIKQEASEP